MKKILASYRTIAARFEDRPEVARIISPKRKTVYVNLSAKEGAKIVQLAP